MIIPARDRNHLLRVECFAEHNKRFHDLRHGFTLGAVQNCLLFVRQDHAHDGSASFFFPLFLCMVCTFKAPLVPKGALDTLRT